ncbi:cytochrome bd-type quinol oxidase subunit 1 [Sphingomonas sp. BE270]|nr:cytochrome bd-type quinol oxidase subunit 1 [Sphingomonas sp. BE270]
MTTEVGRQPYTVYGYLLTAQSRSPLAAPAVETSLLAFVIVYFAVFGAGTYYLLRLMAHAPQAHETEPPHVPQRAAGLVLAAGLE